MNSIATLVKISEECIKIAESSPKIEMILPLDQRLPIKEESAETVVQASKPVKRKKSKSKDQLEDKTQTKKEVDGCKKEFEVKKQEMDLAAEIAFQEYYRPL